MNPTLLNYESEETKRLIVAAQLMTTYSKDGTLYSVGETYFDFGQGWKWTTILAENNSPAHSYCSTWQALYPRQWEKILKAETPKKLAEIVEDILMEK